MKSHDRGEKRAQNVTLLATIDTGKEPAHTQIPMQKQEDEASAKLPHKPMSPTMERLERMNPGLRDFMERNPTGKMEVFVTRTKTRS